MKVILYQPDIPQNTGNILRTCSLTNTTLILVRPLGFSLSSRHFKRAGLDYKAPLEVIDDLFAFLENEEDFFFFSSKAKKIYTDMHYSEDSCLIFGSETSGLDPSFLEKYRDKFVTIPMKQGGRCLNLSCSVSIALYEALRQTGFTFERSKKQSKEEH